MLSGNISPRGSDDRLNPAMDDGAIGRMPRRFD
jgi:hypothetical protein